MKILDFRILFVWIKRYKSDLSKSNSSCHNSYCMRLVIVLLAVNIGKVQFLVSVDNFFCWVCNYFCSDFLLCNVIDLVRMYKSIAESCVDRRFSDRLSSFERSWSSLLRLLMVLWRSLLRTDKASFLKIFCSLKIRNFGYTPRCLQLTRKLMSNFSLFFLYSNFSYFQKSLSVTFPYFHAISL